MWAAAILCGVLLGLARTASAADFQEPVCILGVCGDASEFSDSGGERDPQDATRTTTSTRDNSYDAGSEAQARADVADFNSRTRNGRRTHSACVHENPNGRMSRVDVREFMRTTIPGDGGGRSRGKSRASGDTGRESDEQGPQD